VKKTSNLPVYFKLFFSCVFTAPSSKTQVTGTVIVLHYLIQVYQMLSGTGTRSHPDWTLFGTGYHCDSWSLVYVFLLQFSRHLRLLASPRQRCDQHNNANEKPGLPTSHCSLLQLSVPLAAKRVNRATSPAGVFTWSVRTPVSQQLGQAHNLILLLPSVAHGWSLVKPLCNPYR